MGHVLWQRWGQWLAPSHRALISSCGGRTHSRGSWPQIIGPSAVAGSAGSQEGGGSDLHPCSEDPWHVRTRLWSLRWQLQLTPAPGAHVGGALPPASKQRKKLLWRACPCPHVAPNNSRLPLWQAQFFSQTPPVAVHCPAP